ncbi:GntR family transcriptional regulator [Pararhizobium sp. IMCC21322]|uniref:GntR family transcriptional regulator n=1 Tax=Pararhizobium sp. IMCC21322 TaxID=3067903 RepID=UPI002740C734|nr:GntR family transcriptional regulator [Pararhizobium sp. IMCC21322]
MPRPTKKELEARQSEADIPIFPSWIFSEIKPATPLTSQTYSAMRRAIIEMVLPPGSPVNEKKICEELHISRTPLREALLKLNDEALVKIVPNQRTTVAKIDLETMLEGQLIRQSLEVKLVRLAAMRMTPAHERALDLSMYQQHQAAAIPDLHLSFRLDEEFHELIASIGASSRTWRIIKSAKAHVDRVRHLAYPRENRLDQILEEHAAIVTALKSRDPGLAREAMHSHLGNFFNSLQFVMNERKELFSHGAEELLAQHLSIERNE